MDHCDVPAWALVSIYTFVQCLSFLTAEQFPSHLKRGQKIPIYKIRDTSIYRPISMTSALSKRSEKVMRDQTDHYLEKNHLFSPIQFAFRRGFFFTTDALLYAIEKLGLSLSNIASIRLLKRV